MATYVDAKVHELDELAVHEGELLRGGERRCGGYEVVCLPEVEDEHKRASALHDDALGMVRCLECADLAGANASGALISSKRT